MEMRKIGSRALSVAINWYRRTEMQECGTGKRTHGSGAHGWITQSLVIHGNCSIARCRLCLERIVKSPDWCTD